MRSELEVFNRAVLNSRLGEIGLDVLGGAPYVTFAADELGERDLAFLANLSSVYALFELEGALLRPLALAPLDRFDDDLLTIQRYQGKTNERFTKLLLNVTLLSSAFASEMLDRPFRVLDPLCGRGTTLNQALMYGCHAAGIDSDERDFAAYAQFIETWCKQKRLKHRARAGPVRRDGRVVARRLDLTVGVTKERYAAGDMLELTVVKADTTHGGEFFRAGSFDLVVTDLPYGVQHGSRSRGNLARSPLDLLAAAPARLDRAAAPGRCRRPRVEHARGRTCRHGRGRV
jgi:hypothetical protein